MEDSARDAEELRSLLDGFEDTSRIRFAARALVKRLSRREMTAAVFHDMNAGRDHSLLWLAACTGEPSILYRVLRGGAKALPEEHVYDAFVRTARDHDLLDDEIFLTCMRKLISSRVMMPTATCASYATAVFQRKEMHECLNCMAAIDPWAVHFMQQLESTASVAAEIAAQSSASVAQILAGDADAAQSQADELIELIVTAQSITPTLHALASIRRAWHALVDVHVSEGSLAAVVACASKERLIEGAAKSRDVDLLLALVNTGCVKAHPVQHADAYHMLVREAMPPIDKHGAVVDDDRLAVYMRQFHDAGLHLPAGKPAASRKPSAASCALLRMGYTTCFLLMLDVIDPLARKVDRKGWTLLHHAAQYHRADACAALITAGMSLRARTMNGVTPVGMLFMEEADSAGALVDSLASLLAHEPDARDDVRSCGLFQLGRITARSGHVPQVMRHARVLLHVVAAVGHVTLSAMLHRTMTASAALQRAGTVVGVLRMEPLDAHSSDGVYIADQLRCGGTDASEAILSAVCVDVLLEAQPFIQREAKGRSASRVWSAHVKPNITSGVSHTIQAWAYMRRRQVMLRWRSVRVSLGCHSAVRAT